MAQQRGVESWGISIEEVIGPNAELESAGELVRKVEIGNRRYPDG